MPDPPYRPRCIHCPASDQRRPLRLPPQLFPHPSGPPFRLALRDLMMTHLQRVIQNAGATGEGHSSLEDAAGSVELVRQRAKEMRERQGKLAGGA